jgi:predicted hotdog family 3-hydroxylacyl-ACP dehydratase
LEKVLGFTGDELRRIDDGSVDTFSISTVLIKNLVAAKLANYSLVSRGWGACFNLKKNISGFLELASHLKHKVARINIPCEIISLFLAVFLIQLFISSSAFAAALALNTQPAHDQRVGTPYSQTNVASGGSGSYTYSVSAGTLPAGITLNTSTGTASGTPTSVQSFNYAIQVNDGLTAVTNTVSGSMGSPSLNMLPNSFPNPQRGVTYSQTILPSGGTAPYTFTLSAGTLPPGISLNASTGVFSGIPTTLGTYNFTFLATDNTTGSGAPYSFQRAYNVTVTTGPVLALASTTSSATQIGVTYSQTNIASGGTGSYTYSISAGALPAGLSLNTATGTVSGTPTAAGAFSYTVRVNDGSNTKTQVISGTMAGPNIAINPTLPSGTVGVAYSQTIVASGGTAPYTYSVSAGAIPSGLSLNAATGAITGTPTTANTYNFTTQATDSSTGTSAPFSNTRVYAVAIANPFLLLNSNASNSTQIGVAYSQANAAAGGTGSYTYSVSAGALPAGLSLNTATGSVSGTPTAAGAFSYTIQVSDGSTTATQVNSGTIAGPNIEINPTLPSGTVGVPYSPTIVASGGTAPYTYAVSAGSLPAGLSLNTSTGAITGTPTTANTYNFTTQATDSSTGTNAPFSGTRVYAVVIANPSLAMNATTSTSTKVGTPYSQANTASGGTGSYTYSVSTGALPAGLSLNTATGTVSGIPTAAGTFSYTIQVSDGSTTATQVISGTIAAPTITISRTTLQVPQVGSPFNDTAVATGGTAPYTYSILAGALTAGLSLNPSTGAVTGTPTVAGAFNVTIRATDSSTGTGAPFSQTQAFTGTVINADLLLTSAVSTFTQIGDPYSQANPASGGTGSYTYSVSAGTIPAGLSLNTTTGNVSGTPTAAGAFSYTIRVSDGSTTATQAISGTIAAPIITINPTLPSGTVGVAYSQTIVSSGGTAPYTYSVSAGALPTGLSLNTSSGAITGAPTTATTYNFTIRATDSSTGTGAPFSNTRVYTVAIANPSLLLNSNASPSSQIGVVYSQANAASGGAGSYTYSLSTGALPAGLSLNTATGTVSGTPTAAGAFSYTIRVSDGSTTATQVISGTIAAPTITISHTALQVPQVGIPFNASDPAIGGTAPYTYSISAGALTAGLSLNPSTGAVTGTPTVAGAFNVTIRATDSSTGTGAPFSQTQIFTGTVLSAALVLTSTTSSATQIGQSYLQTNVASGGTTPYTYTLFAGTLPAGTTLGASTGTVSGTPTTVGAFSYTIRVTDSGSQTATQATSGTIAPVTLTLAATASTATQIGQSYLQTNVASGGTTPYTYTLFAGTLPAGTTLGAATGTVSGTPTTIGAFSYTIRVTDSGSQTATTQITSGTIAPVTLILAATASTTTQLGQSYLQTNVASGGTTPYAYTLFAGTLPAGTTLSASTGTVSGTPTAAGAFSYTIKVTDSTATIAQTATSTMSGTVTSNVSTTTTSIASSVNPSNQGQSVMFTATITASGGTATGTVTFKDGSTTLGTGTVSSNRATFATAFTALGVHSITAVYSGDANHTTSTSAALPQSVLGPPPADSVNLRKLQATVTPMAAQVWGQATVNAMQSAISEGFAGGGKLVSPSGIGMRFNFSADPVDQQQQATDATSLGRDRFGSADLFSDTHGSFDTNGSGLPGPGGSRAHDGATSRTDDAFAAFGYAGPVKKGPPSRATEPREWLGWAEISGATLNRWTAPTAVNEVATAPTVYGDQINVTAGLTRVLTPNFLVGVLGGWETFDYRSDAIQGRLQGNGWTTGAYAGWKLSSTIRFDAGVAYSGIGFDGTAGQASGSFAGNRLLVTGGFTGNYQSYGFLIEPSARVYALWEHENAYTDSLGTAQAGRDFSTGRASTGLKVAYPFAWTDTIKLSPYAGIYGDYYFNTDNISLAGAGALPVTPVFAGLSARTEVGITAQFASGGQLTVGGERSGLGGSFSLWTYRARASIPFSAQ